MDTEGLLRSLNAHSVRYVIIGATAFPVHGYARRLVIGPRSAHCQT